MKTKVATSQGRINQREPLTDPYISMMLKYKDIPYLASLGVVAIDLPAGEIHKEEEDADDEEYEHGSSQPHHFGVVLLRQIVLASLQHLSDRPPELHGFK